MDSTAREFSQDLTAWHGKRHGLPPPVPSICSASLLPVNVYNTTDSRKCIGSNAFVALRFRIDSTVFVNLCNLCCPLLL